MNNAGEKYKYRALTNFFPILSYNAPENLYFSDVFKKNKKGT